MRKLASNAILAAVLSLSLAAKAHADIIFTDDFESTVNTSRWQVYQDLSSENWTVTQGSGVEVQRNVVVGVAPGDYELEYYYQARTNTPDDNIISVYADTSHDQLFSTLLDTANGVGADGWVQRTVTFSVGAESPSMYLSFRAEGVENSLGGFVDSVSLQRVGAVPAPAGSGLIMFAFASMGIIAARRRQRSKR